MGNFKQLSRCRNVANTADSPFSIRSDKNKLPEDTAGLGSLYLASHAASHESALRLGHGIYDRYYRDPAETAAHSVNGQQRQHSRIALH
jgi:hypothetical protein